jgi:hypothetical protein
VAVEFRETVTVSAPVADVVRVLLDVERWPSWTASMSRISRTAGPGPLAVGDTVRIKQPRLLPATWTVTTLNESGFRWTSSMPGVRSTGDHWAVDAGDGRTTVTLGLTFTGPLARPIGMVYAGLVRRYMRMEAEGLRREVEA